MRDKQLINRWMKRIAFALLAACFGTPARMVNSQAVSSRATLTGNVPPWANSASFKSASSSTDWVNFRVYLSWTDPAGAESLARAVSDPQSASYGQYLTPHQFRGRFSPSQISVGAVQKWLASQGLNVVYTPQNNHYVAAEGMVAQVAAAFETSFANYTVQGLTLRAPASDPSVPASLGGIVSAVVGLDQTAQLVHLNIARDPDAPPSPAFVSAQPCSAYWGEKPATGFPNPYGDNALPYVPCGYTPLQIHSAYQIPSTTGAGHPLDGAGQTVAIIDAFTSPTIQEDLDNWSANRVISSTHLIQVVAPGTYHHPEAGLMQDPQGWYGEETLDVEAVHGMAPGANIVFVSSANAFQDLDAALNHVVERGLAQIVTNSYGFNGEFLHPGFIKPYEEILIEAAIQGIGVYFSSGDNSDESLVIGVATTDWPASSPWVTAVGGTSIGVGASGEYLFETGWGTRRSRWNSTCTANGSLAWCPRPPGTWLYGSGGGVSRLFPEPWYQVGVVPDAVFTAQGRTGRAVPDVAVFADPNTGYLIGQRQTFPDGSVAYSEYRIGGTSLSSPILAGIMALADQASGSRHGFANPALYAIRASNTYSEAFHDVTDPSNTVAAVRVDYYDFVSSLPLRYTLRTMNQTLSLQTAPGWDDVTGLGTPNEAFVPALSH